MVIEDSFATLVAALDWPRRRGRNNLWKCFQKLTSALSGSSRVTTLLVVLLGLGSQLNGYRAIELEPLTASEFVRFPDNPTMRLIYRWGGAGEQPLDSCPKVDFRSITIASPQKFGFASQERTRMVRPQTISGRVGN